MSSTLSLLFFLRLLLIKLDLIELSLVVFVRQSSYARVFLRNLFELAHRYVVLENPSQNPKLQPGLELFIQIVHYRVLKFSQQLLLLA